MRRPSFFLRCLVLLSLWLGALLPAVAQVVAADRAELTPWTQVCRASLVSPRAQQGDYPSRPRQEEAAHDLLAHAACCVHLAQDLAPPPATPPVFVLPAGLRQAMPERFYSAPQSAHAWQPAQSRAPPAFILS